MTALVLSCVRRCAGRMRTMSPAWTRESAGKSSAWARTIFSVSVRPTLREELLRSGGRPTETIELLLVVFLFRMFLDGLLHGLRRLSFLAARKLDLGQCIQHHRLVGAGRSELHSLLRQRFRLFQVDLILEGPPRKAVQLGRIFHPPFRHCGLLEIEGFGFVLLDVQ